MISSEHCPNCQIPAFLMQPQKEDIGAVLTRWEQEAGIKFRDETINDYKPDGITAFYKCASCGFGAFRPPFSGTSNFYRDITIEGDYYVTEKWEFKKTFQLIEQYSPKSVLDYGCGGGAFLKIAAQKFNNCSFHGYDQNPEALLAGGRNAIDITNNLTQFKPASFDMVTAFQIIEHLEDPFSVLQTLSSLLKPDGIIVISVPNTDGPIRHFPHSLTEIPPHHINRFGRESLNTYLRNAGFKPEQFACEPLSKVLWPFYLPVMVRELLPEFLRKVYLRARGPDFVRVFVAILNKTGLQHLPIKGHSIYVVAKKCAE